MTFTKDDFLVAYPPDKRTHDAQFWWMRWVALAAFYPSRLFLALGWSANRLTVLSLVAICASVPLLAQGSRAAAVAGLLLLYVWQLLDSSDGVVARHTGQSSRFGAFLDTACLHLAGLALWVGLGFGAARAELPTLVAPEAFVPIGLAIALCLLTSDVFGYVFHSLDVAAPAQAAEPVSRAGARSHGTLRRAVWLLRLNMVSLGGLPLPAGLVAAATGTVPLFLLVYLVIAPLDVLFAFAMFCGRTIRQDRTR